MFDIIRLTEKEKTEAWGFGEWVTEPDFVPFAYKDTACFVVRRTFIEGRPKRFTFGHLCGYIEVPQDHPWRKLDPSRIPCEVHGGITYGKQQESGEYLIGFDCAHGNDVVPYNKRFMDEMTNEVKKDTRQ